VLKSIIIDGVDRIGKSNLITALKQRMGFFQEIHYKKPEQLASYQGFQPLQRYQFESFTTMFHLLTVNRPLILNRSHLGEYVYSSRYRGYDGSYVFNLEQKLVDQGLTFNETTLVVLLHTSNFNFITDDGKSFDVSQREEEQHDFHHAFTRSIITHKVDLDVHDGYGNFVPVERLVDRVERAYKHLASFNHTPKTVRVSWVKDQEGNLESHETFHQF